MLEEEGGMPGKGTAKGQQEGCGTGVSGGAWQQDRLEGWESKRL